ncbi:uncharacterized protein EDB93DRAFT_1093191 [Suillus bovinus]|uniref:uncharacterized protein n=1 Tax=Suillus bovinus TaxID=48563 RepID=UPI001B865EA7|nr:uncharacterized protein EDB93DRAFT_1093191 [Suillus bovinus]KAG2133665.1 hypothetical protein EDB93DRAFT_1093191 [Suillus bovinus]
MRSTALCSTCSSCLPPKASPDLFITECCARPICPTCISSNPRLRSYNPCLSCLGGVGVVSSFLRNVRATNNDTVRDEDIFILGDDEDDEDQALELALVSPTPEPAPPVHPLASSSSSSLTSGSILITQTSGASAGHAEVAVTGEQCTPSRYYINPRDTLQGIALRYGVNGRELCRLNNLPPSTLSTTPHLLHTRTFVVLTPSAKSLSITRDADADAGARRVREKAEKRLQMLTKEVDWRVAKAYVALADDPEEEVIYGFKYKETGGNGANTLEARAADQYLEDQEWEEEQRRAGKRISLKSLAPLRGKVVA